MCSSPKIRLQVGDIICTEDPGLVSYLRTSFSEDQLLSAAKGAIKVSCRLCLDGASVLVSPVTVRASDCGTYILVDRMRVLALSDSDGRIRNAITVAGGRIYVLAQ